VAVHGLANTRQCMTCAQNAARLAMSKRVFPVVSQKPTVSNEFVIKQNELREKADLELLQRMGAR
jgi:hypothetical protein